MVSTLTRIALSAALLFIVAGSHSANATEMGVNNVVVSAVEADMSIRTGMYGALANYALIGIIGNYPNNNDGCSTNWTILDMRNAQDIQGYRSAVMSLLSGHQVNIGWDNAQYVSANGVNHCKLSYIQLH